MSRTHGSQYLLQTAVNRRPELLTAALRRAGALGRRETIEWRSPLKSDRYREYEGADAFGVLGLEGRLSRPLSQFWPARGAVWDALGITSNGRYILLEAKAHIPELASPGTRATPASKALIETSLRSARRHYAPKSTATWHLGFYQYANRLAHLYWLTQLNKLPGSLVFLYFTNAVDMNGPATREEWEGAKRLVHALLGLPVDMSSHGVYSAYLDAAHLADLE